MKKLLILATILFSISTLHSQINLSDTSKIQLNVVANDSTFLVIKNKSNIEINESLKRKIEFYRRDIDYIWKPEEGIEILIYKK